MRGLRDDFFAQQRAAVVSIRLEIGIDLIGAIDVQIEAPAARRNDADAFLLAKSSLSIEEATAWIAFRAARARREIE